MNTAPRCATPPSGFDISHAFRPALDQARCVVVDEWDRINGLVSLDPLTEHPLAVLMRERGWRPVAVLGEYEIYAPPPRPQ